MNHFSVKKLQERYGTPFWDRSSNLLWGVHVTQEHVLQCIADGDLREEEWGVKDGGALDTRAHAARIAWFVKHGWQNPIQIDVGVPSLGHHPTWPISDGNHRYAAAIIRGDKTILGEASGQVDVFEELIAS